MNPETNKPPFYTYAFEKLEVWQAGRALKKTIFGITRKFPKEEMFGLTSQIRRSMGSVTANLAEGSGRASDNDRAHFANIAYTNGLETLDHFITAFDCGYISETEYHQLRLDIDKLLNKLNAYYKYLNNRKDNLKNKL